MELLRIRKRWRKGRKPFYETTCTCKAYHYPHRFSVKRCCFFLLDYFWDNGHCGGCDSRVFDDRGAPSCQVIDGGERIDTCPCLQEVFHDYEIKIPGEKKGYTRHQHYWG